ncbi:MAG: amino acid ABC transporter permease [Thermodesulfobacteriota bacterium]
MYRTPQKHTLLDLIILLLFLSFSFYVIYRVRTGLDYNWQWHAMPQFLFRFDPTRQKWVANILIMGLVTTIRLSIWGTLLALLVGIMMGLMRISRSLFKRLISRTYVELIRNLPPLVLIFIFYYFVSSQILPALGIETFLNRCSEPTVAILNFLFAPPDLLPQFLSAVVTLAVFEGAYITEIVRAGIQSIEKGQWEASAAIGLYRMQRLHLVILPQAVRKILPPLAGQFISTIKDTAIVSVISIQELTFQGIELMAATYLTFEVWITITVLYLFLTLTLSLVLGRLEIYMKPAGSR